MMSQFVFVADVECLKMNSCLRGAGQLMDEIIVMMSIRFHGQHRLLVLCVVIEVLLTF